MRDLKNCSRLKLKVFYVLGDKLELGPNLKGHRKLYISEKKKLAIYGEKDSKSISHLTLPKAQVSPITRFSD
jgi:hypothetical protein